MNPYLDIATLTIAEFRNFKRALRVLYRAGLSLQDAVEILMHARDKRMPRKLA